jgi:dihydrofolate synthase/folylpolyglutamate synthase
MSAPGIIPGLERIERLLAGMGNPERDIDYVHIAGTNGKGSVSVLISSLLKEAGYRVGQFTSPHLHSYLERITVSGAEIDGTVFLEYLEKIGKVIAAMEEEGFSRPSEFEILTALAFQYFRDKEVDIAVLEVGMGGLYDSSNVITPLLSIITSIDYDHTAFLGKSLQEIAFNKAGIIKNGIPVIIGPMEKEAFKVISNRAKLQESTLYSSQLLSVNRKAFSGLSGQFIDISYEDKYLSGLFFSLLGDYQLKNLAIALQAIFHLRKSRFFVSDNHIRETLRKVSIPGRMEIFSKEPPVVFDLAHNPHAARALASSLHNFFPENKGIMVVGLLDDKDASEFLKELGKQCRSCVVTRPESPRAEEWQRVMPIWNRLFPQKEVFEKESIERAVEKGLSLMQKDEYLLVTGSFYVLDRARRYYVTKS